MEDKSLYVEVDKLNDKRYQLDVLSLIVYNSWMDEDIRVIKKKDLRKILMTALKIDSRKTTRLINNFIDLGILEAKGYSYIIHKAKPPFLNIPIPTLIFLLLSKISINLLKWFSSFKICFLKFSSLK